MMKLLVFAAILGLAAAQLDHHVLHCKDQRPLIQIGSSTAFPISRQHAVRYANPMVAPMAFPTGSNVGFSNFLSGAADIATSSRKLMPSDYAAADCDPAGVTEDGVATEACQGRLPVGVKIASDRVTIIVSKAAVWVPEEGVTSEQVLQLFNVQEPASWRDVFPEGIVDEAFPSLPGPQTGTLTYFSEATGLNFTGSFAFSSHLSIRSFIRSHAFAIGILPYSFAAVATEDVNVLNVDGINPLDREAEGYPYERPLYKYYDAAPGADNEQALDFLCTLLDTEGQQIIEIAGHIPLPEEERAAEYEMLGCESRNVVNKLDELTGPMQEASFCRDAVKLVAMGSSTVFPIIEEVGRVYPNPIVNIVARSSGSSVGMDSLIEGAADIAMMSRLVQVSDYTKFGCRSSGVQGTRAVSDCNGVRPNAITIGTDMLAIVAHPDSELSDLSMEDVMAIFVNQTTENMLYVPDSNSGTRDFFEANVGPIDTQGFSDDNEIITNIAADVNGIGFVGAAYATDPRVKVLSVEGISPLDNNPEYAMSRALWLYYDGSDDHYNKAMNEFLCWMLNADGGQKVVESVGYLPLEETDRLTEAFLRGCLELPESFGM